LTKRKIYTAKPTAPFPQNKAQEVGEELERIREEFGKATPEVILEASRPKKSVLHSYFDWEDAIAAEKHRKQQARHISNSVTCEVIVEGGEKKEVRAFVNVKKADESEYVPIEVVMKNKDLRQQMLANALKELIGIKQKYQTLKELSEIWDAIDYIQMKFEFEKKKAEKVEKKVTTQPPMEATV